MRLRRRHRGYVLILTLVVLTIAGTLLAAACRASLRKAILAARAEVDLQRRWGALSARTVLLPQAELAFEDQREPAATVTRHIQLGRERFVLVFGDEQAKANVNQLWRSSHGDAERNVRALTHAAGSNLVVELSPGTVERLEESGDELPRVFTTFGQIFRDTPPAEVLRSSEHITCWSDGTLNFTRSSRSSLAAVCGGNMGGAGVEKLLKIRSEQPDASYSDALVELSMPVKSRSAVEDLLTDSSTCFSLWIVTGSGGGTQYQLSVLDGLSEADGFLTFTW